jgi:hypothetical protein
VVISGKATDYFFAVIVTGSWSSGNAEDEQVANNCFTGSL